ncbi:MAG: SagB/ThcOx family dehydrogenase [Phycisphaerae bacterium]
MSLERAIALRRSCRAFRADSLSAEQIGQLFWSAQGITEPQRGRRAAPSAGATYPLELYAVRREGVFCYRPAGHELAAISERDVRSELARAAWDQEFIAQAPLTVAIAAVLSRTAGRYGGRAARYVHIEVGHVAENIHLQAVAMGLGSVAVGAFDDRKVKQVLALPAEQEPLYLIPVGWPA